MERRKFIVYMMTMALLTPFSGKAMAMGLFGGKINKGTSAGAGDYPFMLSDAEWRKRLGEQQYHVLRDHGTERAFTSPLNEEKRNGSFHCAGCDNLLFSSAHKFDSGTGWPSFWQPAAEGAVGTSTDHKLVMPRTEVHCANCGGHLGHVFNDGPPPTGLRYCINGVALIFKPV